MITIGPRYEMKSATASLLFLETGVRRNAPKELAAAPEGDLPSAEGILA
jgi:hypothetical protein